jgi:hypothetical protein
MKLPKFNRGDWVFCEFKLQQVKETREDCITSVTDGIMEHGSSDLSDRCFPLNMRIKLISGEVAYWDRKLHDLQCNSLNHPDLNRALIERWVEMCENTDDDKKLQKQYENLAKFCRAIIERVEDSRSNVIDGVKIFR